MTFRTKPPADWPPCGDENPSFPRCCCHLPKGHTGFHAHAQSSCDARWPNAAKMMPCTSTEIAVLGAVGEPVRLRCGQIEGHDGNHRFHMEWANV